MRNRAGELGDGALKGGDKVSDAGKGVGILDREVGFCFGARKEFERRVAKVKQEAITDRVKRKRRDIHSAQGGEGIVAQDTGKESLRSRAAICMRAWSCQEEGKTHKTQGEKD